MTPSRLATTSLVLALLSGCGSNERAARVDEPPPPVADAVEVVIETVPIPETLPPDMCFVGLHDYDVMLQGQNLVSRDSCAELARRFFPGVEQLPWSPAAIDNPDWTNECTVSRGRGRLAVARGGADFQGPRFERAYALAERICEGLRGAGWEDVPPSEWG